MPVPGAAIPPWSLRDWPAATFQATACLLNSGYALTLAAPWPHGMALSPAPRIWRSSTAMVGSLA